MIRYRLNCDKNHEFEGWFRDSAGFDKQVHRGQVLCPQCGSNQVTKALMAPNVSTAKKAPRAAAKIGEMQKEMLSLMCKIREHVESNADYVGDRFADEARKIHHEEVEPRDIYGEATAEETKGLYDEGIEFMPLPVLPEEQN